MSAEVFLLTPTTDTTLHIHKVRMIHVFAFLLQAHTNPFFLVRILMKWIPSCASFKRAAFSLVYGVLLCVYDKKNQLNEATALMSKDNVTRLLKIFCHAHFCSYFKAVHYILLIKPRIIERSFKRRISGAHWNMDWASVASFLNIQTLECPKPAPSPAPITETPLFCIRSSAEWCGPRWPRCREY